jgi:carboxymethylenebutenolidase
MGIVIEVAGADGHTFSAYRAGPEAAEKGLVVVQEIFGVNHHMRMVCDRFAAAGYAVIAPALFDRAERGVELRYDGDGIQRGLALRAQIPEQDTIADIEAAAAALGRERVGIVGYCWGGTLAWLGAARTQEFAAAVGWYGGGIADARQESLSCPVQLHFGVLDQSIPMADVAAIARVHPEVEIFTYADAGHGFGCEARESYVADAAELAQDRTLVFLRKHL